MQTPTQPPRPAQRSFLFTRDKELSEEAAEDYAIRKVPYHWKRSPASFVVLVFGLVTSVFAFALGGTVALAYGMPTLVAALIIAFLIGAPLAAVVAWQTTNSSIDSDLLSRGAGFGFMGSTITAAIYGMNWIMYAGFEAAFLGAAVHTQWPSIPLWLLYAVASAILVPLNWYGVSQMHWIQKWTVPIFVVGLVWLFIVALGKEPVPLPGGGIQIKTLLPALAAVLGNVAIWILLVGDFARFGRKEDRRKVVLLTVIVAMGGEFLLLAMLGGILAKYTGSANPGAYTVGLIGIPGLIWILVTQMRVQEGNYYSGSLSLVNFSARVLHWMPGRRFFVVVVAFFAFLLAQLKIVDHLTNVLTFMAVFLFAWVGVMVWSLIGRRRLLESGEVWVEHRRGYLRNWGWPAMAGLVVGSAVGVPLALSGWPEPYGGFLGIVSATILAPLVFAVTDRIFVNDPQYLIDRVPDPDWRDTNNRTDAELEAPEMQVVCGISGVTVMKPDALTCPVSPNGIVSSAACQSHGTCGEICKTPEGARRLLELQERLRAAGTPVAADATTLPTVPNGA